MRGPPVCASQIGGPRSARPHPTREALQQRSRRVGQGMPQTRGQAGGRSWPGARRGTPRALQALSGVPLRENPVALWSIWRTARRGPIWRKAKPRPERNLTHRHNTLKKDKKRKLLRGQRGEITTMTTTATSPSSSSTIASNSDSAKFSCLLERCMRLIFLN